MMSYEKVFPGGPWLRSTGGESKKVVGHDRAVSLGHPSFIGIIFIHLTSLSYPNLFGLVKHVFQVY